jgi:hypothetical protein
MRALTTCLVLLVGLAGPAAAQDVPVPPTPPVDRQSIDAGKLGVDLGRIKKGLRVAETREKLTTDGLRLNFSIQVYGQSPKIDVLQGIDLFNGAVPGTAPSHNQMIEFWTPAIYRTPGLPISALAYWAAQHFWEKSKKTRCEEEIATYRALIMQGVNVSAPGCTQ